MLMTLNDKSLKCRFKGLAQRTTIIFIRFIHSIADISRLELGLGLGFEIVLVVLELER